MQHIDSKNCRAGYMKVIAITMCISLGSAGTVVASETDDEASHGEEEHHKHSLGLFGGVTREHGDNLGTLGIEYAYRVNKAWSIGALVERADRENDSTIALVFAHFHPHKGWFLGGGIGRKDPGDERQNTYRASIGYEFELGGGWAIAPQANLDFIEHEENEEVYGISFVKLF